MRKILFPILLLLLSGCTTTQTSGWNNFILAMVQEAVNPSGAVYGSAYSPTVTYRPAYSSISNSYAKTEGNTGKDQYIGKSSSDQLNNVSENNSLATNASKVYSPESEYSGWVNSDSFDAD